MLELLLIISLACFFYGAITLLMNQLRKKPRKKSALITAWSFVILIGVAFNLPPTAYIEIADLEVTTDSNGIAIVEGETNSGSLLTVDGKEVEHEEGIFSYQLLLEDENSKEVAIVARIEDSQTEKIITVHPSAEYVALIQENRAEEERLKEVEAALVLAESEPTEENFNKAATLITSLSKEYDHVDKQFSKIKTYIDAEKAVKRAEKELTNGSLNNAKLLVGKIELTKNDFDDRLATIQAEVDQRNAQIAVAEEAIKKAEEDPTDENYSHAETLLAELPKSNTKLRSRIAVVKVTIDDKKKEEKRLAEEKAKQEEEARIAAEEAAERERLAREEAAEQERIAQENLAKETTSTTPEPSNNVVVTEPSVENVVYIAPYSGTKYHYDPNCRGLRRANAIEEMSLTDAQAAGYGLCGYED